MLFGTKHFFFSFAKKIYKLKNKQDISNHIKPRYIIMVNTIFQTNFGNKTDISESLLKYRAINRTILYIDFYPRQELSLGIVVSEKK